MEITFILEWENAVLSELDRTESLLVQLFNQTQGRPEIFELLVLYNSNQVTQDFIKTFMDDTIRKHSLSSIENRRIIDVLDAHYFQLKNRGVIEAKGELITFLDSDIIPADDWLGELLNGHIQHPNDLVSGMSYIDHEDLMGKAFALNWFFPLPTSSKKLKEVSLIHSNNYIARREILLANPYPKMAEGVTRGADVLLWEQMKAKGIKLFIHEGAKASHPCPNGWSHFFNRGMAEGRDAYQFLLERELADKSPGWQFFKQYAIRCRKVFTNTFSKGKRVDLQIIEFPLVIGIMIFYYQLYFIGGFAAKTFPKYSGNRWQI
jgi:hypothetical protein